MEIQRMLDPSSSPSATHKPLIYDDFFDLNHCGKASEFIEVFAQPHSPLAYFRESFREVRREISPNSPSGSSAVRLRDAEMQHAQILKCGRRFGFPFQLSAGVPQSVVSDFAFRSRRLLHFAYVRLTARPLGPFVSTDGIVTFASARSGHQVERSVKCLDTIRVPKGLPASCWRRRIERSILFPEGTPDQRSPEPPTHSVRRGEW